MSNNRKRFPKPKWQIRIAEERISNLFLLAEKEALRGEKELARRYVSLARRIGEKVNIRLGRKYGKKFCRKCNTYFTSETLKVRADKKTKTISYICLECGYIRRYPYNTKNKKKK